jgi:hypothetical protein
MECKCNNSIKYEILSYLEKNNNFYEINELIINIYKIINQEENKELINIIANLDNINENFIKGYIKNLINEMLNKDKNILNKTLDLNDKNKYYFMNINKNNINNLLKTNNKNDDKENKIKKLSEEKNINLFEDKSNNVTVFQKSSNLNYKNNNYEKENKIKDLIILKKKLELIKKEKNNKKMNHLHKYNEIKDTAQNILGAIANNKNISVKELYSEKEINDNDDEEI